MVAKNTAYKKTNENDKNPNPSEIEQTKGQKNQYELTVEFRPEQIKFSLLQKVSLPNVRSECVKSYFLFSCSSFASFLHYSLLLKVLIRFICLSWSLILQYFFHLWFGWWEGGKSPNSAVRCISEATTLWACSSFSQNRIRLGFIRYSSSRGTSERYVVNFVFHVLRSTSNLAFV